MSVAILVVVVYTNMNICNDSCTKLRINEWMKGSGRGSDSGDGSARDLGSGGVSSSERGNGSDDPSILTLKVIIVWRSQQ